ncbi:MAG: hypothetical protein JWQ83_1148 [Lacunisphaera sp.]|nr:hypothetical protein [Lacunisphaera sp.]
MKRRDFIIGTAAVATVAALPRPVIALPAGEHVGMLLRSVAAGGAFSTAPWREIPDREYYDLIVGGWRITLFRLLWIGHPSVIAHVEHAFDPDGLVRDQFDWGGGIENDPLRKLAEEDQAAFDRAVVADMRKRLW